MGEKGMNDMKQRRESAVRNVNMEGKGVGKIEYDYAWPMVTNATLITTFRVFSDPHIPNPAVRYDDVGPPTVREFFLFDFLTDNLHDISHGKLETAIYLIG